MIGKRILSTRPPGQPVFGRSFVVDLDALPREFLKVDEDKLREALARGDIIPGVVVGEDALLGIRHAPDPMVSNPGEYLKRPDGSGWDAMAPDGSRCFFKPGQVTEHEDGTISVEDVLVERRYQALDDAGGPKIDAKGAPVMTGRWLWRGAIVAGKWEEAL